MEVDTKWHAEGQHIRRQNMKSWTPLSLSNPSRNAASKNDILYEEFMQKLWSTEVPQKNNVDDLTDDTYYTDLYHNLAEKEFDRFYGSDDEEKFEGFVKNDFLLPNVGCS